MSMKQLLSKLGRMLNLADPLEACICFFSGLPAVIGGHASYFLTRQEKKVPLRGGRGSITSFPKWNYKGRGESIPWDDEVCYIGTPLWRLRGSYQGGRGQFISLSHKDRTRSLQTKAVKGKIRSALRRHESVSPAKNCTGLTLVEDSERDHALVCWGWLRGWNYSFLSAAGCAWLTGPNHLMGLKT